MLTHAQARSFYDRYGSRQDKSSWYEDPPIAVMLAHSAMAQAQSVLEFGCGTGRIAARLLQHELAPEARYVGLDASSTMARLAAGRLQPYRARATVCLTGGPPQFPVAGACCDRFLSTYVLDLLSPDDICRVLREAQRVLRPGGLLCLVSLTHGATPVARGWNDCGRPSISATRCAWAAAGLSHSSIASTYPHGGSTITTVSPAMD